MLRYMIFTAIALLCAPLFPAESWGEEASDAEKLDLEEAVSIALSLGDPTVTRFEERASALGDRAIADSQLADPQMTFRMLNFPTDSFRFGQEAMTQIQVGLRQAFPRGKTLSFTRERREAEARIERAKLRLQERDIALNARDVWLELYYWINGRQKVLESRQAVSELVEVATATFATGRQTSQDVLRAELELSILNDRVVDFERRIDIMRAELSRLVGKMPASRPLATFLPVLTVPSPRDVLRDKLSQHPAVTANDATIEVRQRNIDIANEQYKPGWSIDGNYGVRGGDRADFATVGVAIDLPFFTGKRQDRNVSASKRERQAAVLDRDATLLELNKVLERTYADWRRLDERISLYEKVVIDRASETTDAALGAYRSGVSDFAELIRARLAELDAELTLLRLKVDRAQAQARLLYLEGI